MPAVAVVEVGRGDGSSPPENTAKENRRSRDGQCCVFFVDKSVSFLGVGGGLYSGHFEFSVHLSALSAYLRESVMWCGREGEHPLVSRNSNDNRSGGGGREPEPSCLVHFFGILRRTGAG